MSGHTRRNFLAGGAALLWASRVGAQAAARPKRFIAMYMPNGCFPANWFPQGDEATFTLAASQAPLAPYQQHCLFFSGVDLKVAVSGPGEQHQRGIGAFLTGQTLQTGPFVGNDGTTAGWANGPSLDQMLIPIIGQGTTVKSLQLGVHCAERDVSGAISYASAGRPLLAENNPVQTFRTLFGEMTGPVDDKERLRRRRASVLDAVTQQFAHAERNLCKSDVQRLDEHLQQVRDLETRVTALPTHPNCPAPAAPPTLNYASETVMPQVAKLQIDLLVKAMQCDLTRVATLAYSDAKNHIGLPFLGITSDVHNISHYSDSSPERAQLAVRDRWMVEQLTYLVKALAETPDGDGKLIDNTLVMLGSELGQGNTHSHSNVPVVLAGHGAGFRMGRFLKYDNSSWNDLLHAIYQGLGGTSPTFGASDFSGGPLKRLT
jgi:hypothetical protein